MSAETLAWAMRVKVERAPLKLLLMTVADLANHITGEVFPSIAYLVEATGLSKRTVLACIDELCSAHWGVMERTERRVGRTNQIPVYLFHMPPGTEMISRPEVFRTGAKTPPLSKQVQKRRETGAKTTGKEVQKRTPEPSRGNQVEEKNPLLPAEEGPPIVETDLFGQPVLSDEEKAEQESEIARARDDAIVDFVVDKWRALVAENPIVPSFRKMEAIRRREILDRTAEHAEDGDYEKLWNEVFEKVRASAFLRGLSPPGRDRREPFVMDIDFMLRPSTNRSTSTITKILEGSYADKRTGHTNFDADGRQKSAHERARDRIVADLGFGGVGRQGGPSRSRENTSAPRLGYDRRSGE